ncbi:MAG TPA: protein kinase [Tepidisphaeraceae bacterium]|nr:protein kinase [Tepidisphaeraceae bacterium]
MALSTGTHLGPYEIVAAIGAGGMGEVYRARDTRLNRSVAVKVLPAHLVGDRQSRQRMEREARVISSLSHTHICVLHDIGHQDGIDFLVMEYLEGETLAARLAKGLLAPAQALEFAVQIASALAHAHRQGVFHRDLKPGNIMLTKTGVKLLDFGLAKLQESRAGQDGLGASAMPTATRVEGLTEEGTILGTFQYMPPEQLEGREIDARADIFAFGAVLYEMLAGRRAFEGESQARVIAAIMSTEPPRLSTVNPLLPAALEHIVNKCLAKDREHRWQNAQDLSTELSWIAEGGSQTALEAVADGQRVNGLGRPIVRSAGIVFLLLVAMVLFGARYFRQRVPEQLIVKFTLMPPESTSFTFLAVSPDGRRVTFVATDGAEKSRLWVRALDSVVSQPLAGTEDASNPFWSPDSRSIGFFAQNKLKRIEASGGPVQVIAGASDNRSGGAWSRYGVIIYCPGPLGPLYQVPETGGELKNVTQLAVSRHETGHRWPQFLPDGRHFLYHNFSQRQGDSGIHIGSLDGKEDVRLFASESSAGYAGPSSGPGHILFLRGRSLMAQPFDPDNLRIAGEAVPVADEVGNTGLRAMFSVSSNGVLVFDCNVKNSELRWFDRRGNSLGTIGPLGIYTNVEFSPDDRRIAVDYLNDIWLFDIARNAISRFTFDPALDAMPRWSPDGKRIAFTSTRDGQWNLYQKLSSGEVEEEPLLKSSVGKVIVKLSGGWSPDRRFFLYSERSGSETGWDLWVLPMEKQQKPVSVLQTPFDEHWGRFSPDGKWIAYVSDESGRSEVFVRTFDPGHPESAFKWSVSNGGGELPHWRADGKELYYLGPERQMMVATIEPGGTPSEPFKTSVPRVLFPTRAAPGNISSYSVTSDGQRFLINQQARDVTPGLATVFINWTAGIKR